MKLVNVIMEKRVYYLIDDMLFTTDEIHKAKNLYKNAKGCIVNSEDTY